MSADPKLTPEQRAADLGFVNAAVAALRDHCSPADAKLVIGVLSEHTERVYALLSAHTGERLASSELARLLLSIARRVQREGDTAAS